MNKLILLLISLFAAGLVSAQNQMAGYTWWFNSDYHARASLPLPANKQVSLQADICTDALPTGINVLHIQFYDDSLRYSSPVSATFYKTKSSAHATNHITAYRYWFNNDMDQASQVSVTPAKQVDILAQLDASSLTGGLNILNIQVMDQQELWSTPISQIFFKTHGYQSDTNYIAAYRYWFNNDIDQASQVSVTPAKQVDILAQLDASTLTEGINTVHFQVMDQQGLYSTPVSSVFYKTSAALSDTNRIQAMQYWFGNDLNNAVTQTFTPQVQPIIQTNINASTLEEGINTIHFRFQDEAGLWSSAVSSSFFRAPVSGTDTNYVVAYEYWFDDEFHNPVEINLSTPVNPLDMMIEVDMTDMAKGDYTFNFRAKDTSGLWSVVVSEPFTKEPLPIAIFDASITAFCDAGHVSFTNNSIDGDTYLWDFDDGNTSQQVSPTHFFAGPGQYTVSLKVTDTLTGKDSTALMTITAHPSHNMPNQAHICQGSAFEWRGQLYSQTGTYYDSLNTTAGCDSVYVLNLQVNPVYEFTFHEQTCQGTPFMWQGNSYDSSGIYYDSLTTVHGCDSVLILHLQVNPVYEFVDNETTCQGTPFVWRGNSYDTAGTYYDSLVTTAGCDSVYVLHLQVDPVYEMVDNEVTCQGTPFVWRSNSYTTAGTYYDSLNTTAGCDSVYVLNLQVNPVYEFTFHEQTCQGTPFMWQGSSYDSSGVYYDSLTTVHGCDSVLILQLQVNPVYEFVDNEATCQGTPFVWRGNSYDTAGTYYDSLATTAGCDSVYVLHLQVNPVYEMVDNEVTCQGTPFVWRGNSYTTAGTYYDSLNTTAGCDSVYVLNLQVNPVYEFTFHEQTCQGTPFIWQGSSYDSSGTYYDSLTTVHGCDSVLILHLLVHPVYEFVENETTCQGTPFVWRGSSYDTAGTYYDSLATAAGCDSVYVLHLQVNPVYEMVDNEVTCQGTPFVWRGNSYTAAGTYYDSLTTAAGCDSVYVLHLQVNPVYEFTFHEQTCEGTPFMWQGGSYDNSGTYYDSLTTVHGCDSVLILHLQVNPVYEFVDNEATCQGTPFVWRGSSYDTAGTYYDSLFTVHGCDSVYVLNLQVNSLYDSLYQEAICHKEVFIWRNNTYHLPGIYYDSLLSSAGCDSVFVLDLDVFYVDDSVSLDGITLTSHAVNATYQWIDCHDGYQPVSGADGSSFTPSQDGHYAVVVTQGGCTDTSACISVIGTARYWQLEQYNIAVYPNPGNGLFYLELPKEAMVRVHNVVGAPVFAIQLTEGRHTLNLKHLTSGVYALTAQWKDQQTNIKLIIQK